jgi:hypothetical protein
MTTENFFLGGLFKSKTKEVGGGIDPAIKAAVTDIHKQGKELSLKDFEAYTGKRIEDFTPEETEAFERLMSMSREDVSEIYNTAIVGTEEAADYTRAGAEAISGEEITGAMDPYLEQVLAPQLREIERQQQEQLMKTRGTAAAGGAGFGSRLGLLEGDIYETGRQGAADVTGRTYSAAFQDAYNRLASERGRQFQAAEGLSGLAAQRLGFGQQEYQQRLDQARLAGQVGQTQRGLEQAKRDFEYEEFMRRIEDPYKKLGFYSNLIYQTPLRQTQYIQKQSPFQQLASAAATGASIYMGGSAMGAFEEGGEIKKYPNKGLAALAKEKPEVVKQMGYAPGGSVFGPPTRRMYQDERRRIQAGGSEYGPRAKFDVPTKPEMETQLEAQANAKDAMMGKVKGLAMVLNALNSAQSAGQDSRPITVETERKRLNEGLSRYADYSYLNQGGQVKNYADDMNAVGSDNNNVDYSGIVEALGLNLEGQDLTTRKGLQSALANIITSRYSPEEVAKQREKEERNRKLQYAGVLAQLGAALGRQPQVGESTLSVVSGALGETIPTALGVAAQDTPEEKMRDRATQDLMALLGLEAKFAKDYTGFSAPSYTNIMKRYADQLGYIDYTNMGPDAATLSNAYSEAYRRVGDMARRGEIATGSGDIEQALLNEIQTVLDERGIVIEQGPSIDVDTTGTPADTNKKPLASDVNVTTQVGKLPE